MRFRQPDLHPQSWIFPTWPLGLCTTDPLQHSLSLISDTPTGRLIRSRHRKYHGALFLQNQSPFSPFPKEFSYE